MYKFRDLRKIRAPSMGSRPIDAVCINGHWLDDEINCFRTLNVEGRESFKRSINAQEMVGDGSLYLSSRIPSKTLKVNFYWHTNTIEEYNRDVKKLKVILYQQQIKIRFLDEQDYFYIGTVEELSFEENGLTTKGSLTINCSDPFKYSDEKQIDTYNGQFTINDKDLIYEVKPKRLIIIPNSDGSSIEISNNTTGKKLMANVSYSSQKEIVFNFDSLDFLVDKISHLMDLDLASNFDDFLIKNGDEIQTNVSGEHQIEYEVKQL